MSEMMGFMLRYDANEMANHLRPGMLAEFMAWAGGANGSAANRSHQNLSVASGAAGTGSARGAHHARTSSACSNLLNQSQSSSAAGYGNSKSNIHFHRSLFN